MNEETPQQNPVEVPVEQPQTNTSNQVPEPAPEKKSKKKSVLIVVVAIILLGGVAFTWSAMRNSASKTEVKTTTEEVAKTAPEAKVPADPYAGWSTFTGTCSGASFKYAPDWKVAFGQVPIDGKCQVATVTSPTGNVVAWVADIYLDGPTCGNDPDGGDACPTVKTIAIEPLNKTDKMANVSLVKQVVCNTAGKCEGRVALVKAEDSANFKYPAYTVGTTKRDPKTIFNLHAFYITQGKQVEFANPVSPKFEFTEQAATAWLNSADVQDAVLSLKSFSIN